MTKNNIKVILFASLIVALILPFSAMSMVNAETGKIDSKIRFEKFLALAEQQQETQQIIDRIHDIHGNEDHVKQLESKIQTLQQRMDKLQQEEIDSVVISDERLQSLELQGEEIMKEIRNPQSKHFVDKESAFFVNQITGEIIVVVDSKGADYKQSLQVKKANNIENKVNGVPFTVDVVSKNSHTIVCAEREADCSYSLGGIAIKQGSETSSLGFYAKDTNGNRGFVTVAHGVNYQNAIVKQYPDRIVGAVTGITGEGDADCDCAFVQVTESGFSSVHKVYTGPSTASSTTFATGYPPASGWVMMSGVGSGSVHYGQFIGIIPAWSNTMAFDYGSTGGDSGAPVTTIGSSVQIYGMHKSNGTYDYATPYYKIKADLGLQ